MDLSIRITIISYVKIININKIYMKKTIIFISIVLNIAAISTLGYFLYQERLVDIAQQYSLIDHKNFMEVELAPQVQDYVSKMGMK